MFSIQVFAWDSNGNEHSAGMYATDHGTTQDDIDIMIELMEMTIED